MIGFSFLVIKSRFGVGEPYNQIITGVFVSLFTDILQSGLMIAGIPQ